MFTLTDPKNLTCIAVVVVPIAQNSAQSVAAACHLLSSGISIFLLPIEWPRLSTVPGRKGINFGCFQWKMINFESVP